VIRRIDAGFVSPLRSQALYHGLAEAMDGDTPDTIVFCAPDAPYFCAGYHQNAADVLDLGLCRRRGWPVLWRKIGGGAVYLDRAQLFYQVIVHRRRAPFAVADIYRTYLAAPVLALRRLGLDARLRAANEIEVGGRRIAGTGGGQLGEAVVVVGNVLLDFPDARMAAAWRAPSLPFRKLAREGLRCYLTTLARELPAPPAMDALREALARAYAETLGAPLVPGALTPRGALKSAPPSSCRNRIGFDSGKTEPSGEMTAYSSERYPHPWSTSDQTSVLLPHRLRPGKTTAWPSSSTTPAWRKVIGDRLPRTKWIPLERPRNALSMKWAAGTPISATSAAERLVTA